ncbi:hypothetical protein LTS10_008081 [Elasticomyces elasticus]|nr:hypothetical protein LTS10_008081 [Elasticomyces elasticus]
MFERSTYTERFDEVLGEVLTSTHTIGHGEPQGPTPPRLINVRTLQIEIFHEDSPPYSILSHTWDIGEVSLQEWEAGDPETVTLKKGYAKVVDACKQAQRNGFAYLWADTCCIDKTNSSELAETIQYVDGTPALVTEKKHADYVSARRVRQFSRSRWFERGWTLQELIAPRKVVFYKKDWTLLGYLEDMVPTVSEITHVPQDVLRHEKKVSDCTFAQRLSWASCRRTKRILDVVMLPHYGEGFRAFVRLQKVLLLEGGLSVLAWESPLHKYDLGCFSDNYTAEHSAFLLAPEVSCFQESGDIEADSSSRTTAEYSFTNIGLSGYFPVILRPTAVNEHIFIPLHCYRKGKPHEILALSLRATQANPGRGGGVECCVSPTKHSSARDPYITRLAGLETHQQSLMLNITIRYSPRNDTLSPSDISRSSIDNEPENTTIERARNGWNEESPLPVMRPDDRTDAVPALVRGPTLFAGDLYTAIGHSLVAFIGAAIGSTTDLQIPGSEHDSGLSSTPGSNPLSALHSQSVVAERVPKFLSCNGKSSRRNTSADLLAGPVADACTALAEARDFDCLERCTGAHDHRRTTLRAIGLPQPRGESTQMSGHVPVVTGTASTNTMAVQKPASNIYWPSDENIYTGRYVPKRAPGKQSSNDESGTQAEPIRITAGGLEELHQRSRDDYVKVRPVHEIIKVALNSVVHPTSMDDLLLQFEDVWKEVASSRPRTAASIASVLQSDGQRVDTVRHMMRLLTQRGCSHAQAVDDVTEHLAAVGCERVSIMQWIVAALLPQDAAASVANETLSEGDFSDHSDSEAGCPVDM